MMNGILDNNEMAYLEKYGVSLSEKWIALSETQKEYGISCIETFDKTVLADSSCFDQQDILRIIIGCRSRKCMDKAMENALPSTRIIFWEPEKEAFLTVCMIEDISDIINDDRISIAFGSEIESNLENILADNVGEHNLKHRKIIGYGRFIEKGNREAEYFNNIFNKVIKTAGINEFTRNRYKQQPYENLLYAMTVFGNNSTVGQLFDKIPVRDIPVIIVAAGPSLGANCIELINAKEKSLVIAVTHSMKTLDMNHISPDILTATDPFLDYHVKYEDNKYPLLCSPFVAKECQRSFDGEIIYHGFGLYEGLDFVDRINSDSNFTTDTGSAATDTFTLFLRAGFRTFILVGQDLAYDDEGYTHTGNEIENISDIDADKVDMVPGIYGGSVRTRADWNRFRGCYEKALEEYKDIKLIDATEGGALIRGSEVMTLKEAIETYCKNEYPIAEWLSNIGKGDEAEAERIREWFEQMVFDCSQTEKYIDEAIELNQVIVGKWNDPDAWDDGFKASCRRYDMLYNMILNGTRSVLLNSFSQYEIQRYISNALTLEGDENIVKRMVLEQDLMVSMKKRSKELIEYLNSCLKKIENQSITLV